MFALIGASSSTCSRAVGGGASAKQASPGGGGGRHTRWSPQAGAGNRPETHLQLGEVLEQGLIDGLLGQLGRQHEH